MQGELDRLRVSAASMRNEIDHLKHLSVVRIDEPSMLPHCAEVNSDGDFLYGCSVHTRTCLPLKGPGAAAAAPMLSSDHAIVTQALNLLLSTVRDVDPAG